MAETVPLAASRERCYAAAMAAKPQIAIVGPGRLGSALACELVRAGYRIPEIVALNAPASQRRARRLARLVPARVLTSSRATLSADLIWFCVPDREIRNAARELKRATEWKGKIAFHSCGALASDELNVLRQRGAAVASVHPMMTFVRGSQPQLGGVPFAIEGDAAALRVARRIVRDLGGTAFSISPKKKAAYHAWGAFLSPLLVAMLVAGEQVARAAGLSASNARKRMMPIVRQTLANYARLGPAGAFSGPIVRGDAVIVRRHLRALQRVPQASAVYVALAQAALRYLPARNQKALKTILGA